MVSRSISTVVIVSEQSLVVYLLSIYGRICIQCGLNNKVDKVGQCYGIIIIKVQTFCADCNAQL